MSAETINGHPVPTHVWIDFRDEPANRYWRVYTAPNAFAVTEYVRSPTDSNQQLIKQLTEALENIVCRSCNNRIGWDEWPTKYGDWKKCSSCTIPRAAINAVKQQEQK